MPRILIKHNGIHRHLATATVTHDGSIELFLVRKGVSVSNWEWSGLPEETGVVQKIDFETPVAKTKKISIHTSGRVNYQSHHRNGETIFIPCLLDLNERVPIIAYVIPDIDALEVVAGSRESDTGIKLENIVAGHVSFEFYVIPSNFPIIDGEFTRISIEGTYSLVCVMFMGDLGTLKKEVPPTAFTTLQPTSGLLAQAIEEDVAFLRFKRLMYANSVKQSVLNLSPELQPTIEVLNEIVTNGPGLILPNSEGVWTVLASVQMHHKPELTVVFADSRYSSELIDIERPDKRLEKVRVRFRVYDNHAQKWIKHPVEIIRFMLDARL